jgi:hypothetical protein
MELTYSRVGDYLLPDIKLSDPPPELTEPITKYGAMRRTYLREHRLITYNQLLLSEQLFPHLREVQAAAQERLDGIMSDILVFNPAPDKPADSLAWAAHMTEIRHIAEKMMLDEIVYA